jgi:hypothetical protein
MNRIEKIMRKQEKEYKKKLKQEPFDIVALREMIQKMQMYQKTTDTYPKKEMFEMRCKKECLVQEPHMPAKMLILGLERGDGYERK